MRGGDAKPGTCSRHAPSLTSPIPRLLDMKPKIFSALLVFVLLLHLSGLSWFGDQIRGATPLTQMTEPMFTRIIEQTIVAAPPPAPAPTSAIKTAPKSTAEKKPASIIARASELATSQSKESADPETSGTPDTPTVPPASAAPETLTETTPPASPSVDTTVPATANSSTPVDEQTTTDTWPPDTRLTYRLTGNYRGDLSGSARVQWQRERGNDSSRYQVRLDIRLSGISVASMASQGLVMESGLQPKSYEEQLPGTRRRLTFDGAQIRFHNGSVSTQPNAVQDTASQFVELSRRFATGRESLKPGSEISLWLARPAGMDYWTYDVMEPETLQSPELGAIQAYRLKPRPLANPRGPIIAEMWFAPSLQYLPVRVRIGLGDNNFVDLMVDKIEQSTHPAAVKSDEARPVDPT